MKVEHITVYGNSVIRNSKDIKQTTVDFFKDFQFSSGSKVLDIPHTNLKIKATASPEGAMFDVMKDDYIGFSNICCFEKKYRNIMLDFVKKMSDNPITDLVGKTERAKKMTKIKQPTLDRFLYTVPIFPIALTPFEVMTAGEIEFYIYYSLSLSLFKQ